MKRILVGTDFSAASERAVHVAVEWARGSGAALRLVHVVPPRRRLSGLRWTDARVLAGIRRRASAALKRLADAADPARRVEISTGVVSGSASVAVVEAARAFGADLLIAGARGEHEARRAELTLGATAIKLLGQAPLPLLLVRSVSAAEPKSALAAVDFSPVSALVFAWACASIANGGRVTALHVFEAPFAARLDAYGISRDSNSLYSEEEQLQYERELDALLGSAPANIVPRRIVERGNPIDCIFDRVRELEPDVLVLGRHVRRGRRPRRPWPRAEPPRAPPRGCAGGVLRPACAIRSRHLGETRSGRFRAAPG